MKRTTHIASIAFVLIAVTSRASAKSSTGWEWEGHKEGVTVFTRPVSGSDVPMVKGVVTLETDPQSVWRSITAGKVTVDGLKERKRIGNCGDGCEYVYVRIGNFFITDRHYVIRVESRVTSADGAEQYTRRWTKSTEIQPTGTGAIGVRKIRGSWTVKPVAGGAKTRLTYINHLDLGGYVPPMIFGPKFVQKTYEIVKNVK